MPPVSKFVALAWEFLKTLLVVLIATLLARQFLLQPFFVEGVSMAPNFFDGELLMFEKVSYRFRPPERFEVVTLTSPYRDGATLLKRVIGLPGETIEIRDGLVRIMNGRARTGFILDESAYERQPTLGSIKISLNRDEYFVMGDDRANSSDSRDFGPIKRGDILGRVWMTVFPLNRLAVIQ